jgi:hypothetical protein
MLRNLMLFVLLAAGAFALSGCYARMHARGPGTVSTSYGGGAVVVAQAPPPPRVVVHAPPPAPYQGAVWVDGHWQWNGAQYVWVDGTYIQGRAGYTWTQPRWERRNTGYVYVQGAWAPGHGHVHHGHHGHGGVVHVQGGGRPRHNTVQVQGVQPQPVQVQVH